MVSEFRKQKILYLFNTSFDYDKDGKANKEDFILINKYLASALTKVRGVKPDEATYNLMMELQTKIWEGLLAQADTDGDGVVSADEFVKIWDDYSKNPAAALEWQLQFAKANFQFLDTGNDGEIDVDEFAKVNVASGLDNAKAREAFAKMAKGKAKLTFDDYLVLFNEYFTSENPADPGNYVFGIRDLV